MSERRALPPPLAQRTGWPWIQSQPRAPQRVPNPVPTLRVSVVTPSFNQGKFIEETIRSVLLQDYPHLEYIVMDGGSTDETRDVLRHYEPYLSYLHVGPDGGQSAALAAGFARATGDILAWLNADDIYLPNALYRVAQFFETHSQHDFVAGDVQLIDEFSQPVGMLLAVPSNLFLTRNTGGHGWWQPGTFWRRRAYETCGGLDVNLGFCMDRDLFVRLCSRGKSASLVGEPLAAFRTHSTQKSQTILDTFYREHELLLARHGNPRLQSVRPMLDRVWHAWELASRLRFRRARKAAGVSRH